MAYDIVVGRDNSDKALFGSKGLIYLGKGYVKMGTYTSLSNTISMDVARSHVILVAGKRGTGKCLHEDTLITLSDGSQIPIKNLEKNTEKVLSLNSKLKMEQSEKSDFFSREVNRLIKLKLRSGKEIKLTPEHPLLTIKGWEEAQKIGIGGRIATPRLIPAFGKIEMPEHEIKLLSYLLAEGHLSNGFCLFSNFDEKIVNEFKNSVRQFDDNLRVDIHSKLGCFRVSQKKKKYILNESKRNEKGQFESGGVRYQKSSIIKWLSNIGLYGLLSKDKYIPEGVLKLNKENLSIFLSRLFSCDGSIYKSNNHWEISYASSSKIMIRQIQNLLLRFGILSKLREKSVRTNGKKFDAYELVLNSENALKFIESVGFFGKKEDRMALAREEISTIKKNPNVDTIPREVWEMYKPDNWAEVGRQLGYAHPKSMREKLFYSPSRQTLMQIGKVMENNPLMMLAQSDIFWDEIVSIELLEGKFTVYDICVPDNHNFVANDIIVHNSYTLGVIAEELANLPQETAQNISSIIFDTMGIFWTMKYKNEKDLALLKEWNLESKPLAVRVFVPYGRAQFYKDQGIPIDATFALNASELKAEDWLTLFGIEMTSLPGVLIERIISKRLSKEIHFTIDDIIGDINADTEGNQTSKEIVKGLFLAASSWGIFAETATGTQIRDLVAPGSTTVLDISVYSSIGSCNVRALVINLVARKLFEERMESRKKEEMESIKEGKSYLSFTKHKDPLIWMFIDEAHEFLPKNGKTPATDALIQILREGRQPGISCVLATQQPGQIHHDVMTQSDIVIAHRVTAKQDIEALNEIMQTYVTDSIRKQLDDLPALKGSAIVLDDNSERIYPIRVRPRSTWHGGEAPTAIKTEFQL